MASNLTQRILASDTIDTPVFNLTAFTNIGDGCFRGAFASTRRSVKFPFEAYADKVLDMTGGKMALAANSLFQTDDNGMAFRGILVPQAQSIPYSEDTMKEKGIKPLTASIFEGERKEIWRLVGEGDDARLVRVADEDYARLLQSRRISMGMLTASETAPTQFGDYAYAYIPELRAFDFGVYGKMNEQPFIVSRRHRKKFKISEAQVMEAATADRTILAEVKKTWNEMTERQADFKDYLDFIAKMYGKNSEYYRANEEAIMNSLVR